METRLFSRRRVLGGMAVGAAFGATMHALSPGSNLHDDDNDSPPQLSITQSTDATFSAALSELFPALDSDSRFVAIRPLAALLSHAGGSSLRAYALRWTLHFPKSTFAATLSKYSHPGSLRRNSRYKQHRTFMSGQTDILRPGETRLVTPFFSLSSAAYARSPKRWHGKLKPTEPGSFMLRSLPTVTAVTVECDAAIYKNASFIGVDHNRLADRYRVMRNAEHDEAVSCIRFLNAGNSFEDLTIFLSQHSSTHVSHVASDLKQRWYHQYRRRYAQALAHYRETATDTEMLARLTLASKRPKTPHLVRNA